MHQRPRQTPAQEDETPRERLRDVERVEAFSDGVFAFAVTLLVLAIRIPHPGDADASTGLRHMLLDQWPSYVAFAVSFTVVGTVWANHRLAFSHFVRADHVLVSLNLLELMVVAFLPVPTAVLGTWISSDHNRLTAVLFYGATLTALGIFHNLLWWYGAYWGQMTPRDFPPTKRRALTTTWLGGPILYAGSMALAFIDARISVAGFVLLGIVYLLPTPRIIFRAQREKAGRR